MSIHPGEQREKKGLGGAVLHEFLLSVQEILQRTLRAHTSTCSTHIANKVIYTILCQHSLLIPSADKERIWKGPARPNYKLGWVSLLSGGRSTRCCIVPLLCIDSNRTMAAIRQRGVKTSRRTIQVKQIILIILHDIVITGSEGNKINTIICLFLSTLFRCSSYNYCSAGTN